MRVNLFFRTRVPGFNSIEELFGQLIQEDQKKNEILNVFHLPFKGMSPFKFLRNVMYCIRNKGEVNHITGDIHFAALGLGKNTLLTIHDIKSIRNHSNSVKAKIIELLWFILPCKICSRISFISEFSRKEFLEFYPQFQNKTVVIHNPAPEIPLKVLNFKANHHIQSEFDLEILQIGTKSNKNLEGVIEAVSGRNYKLHIVGNLSVDQKELLSTAEVTYEHYFDLPYEELLKLYIKCHILTFVSFYEGFGVPIVEAQILGTPVLTSTCCSMPEVAGDAALCVNPYNVDEIREGLLKMEEVALREKMIRKGHENVKRFDRSFIYDKYLTLYEEIKRLS